MSDENPETTELRKVQARRETEERKLAQSDDQPQEETAQHKRRAEKAHYLREKLEDRGKSEREKDSEPEQ